MKTNNTFTIHTELIEGSLDGARNIYMGANSTCHLYVIPREQINMVNNIEDINGQPAFYILLSPLDAQKPQAYIGQTTNFANRKNDHNNNKSFWTLALVFISDNHKIYGDDVRYLEYLGIEAAQNAKSYSLLNDANPKKPNIAPFRVNDMEVFFRDIELLCKFYGCNIFEEPKSCLSTKPQIFSQHYFYAVSESRQAHGIGYYNESEHKFILSEGSILAPDSTQSFKQKDLRDKFIKEYCIKEEDKVILLHDVTFDTPSSASGYVFGRTSNGWEDWRDDEGKKLSEVVKRKKVKS